MVQELSDDEGDVDEDLVDLGGAGEVQARNLKGLYVVSIVGRSGLRTLHRAGECYREPGVHYSNFEVLGDSAPGTEAYHKACKVCFPKGEHECIGSPEDDSSGDVSSSDSTDSSEEDM